MSSSENSEPVGSDLDNLLAAAALEPLTPEIRSKFDKYLELILRWNARMNLTAIRDPQEIQSRHFLESIVCARRLPEGIGSLLDFGTGAGFPGIPIAICHPEIAVTLAESQGKKAAFLREAGRVLGLNMAVFGQRAEQLPQQFDCVTLRAVDRMELAISSASILVRPGRWLVVMTTLGELPAVKDAAGKEFTWEEPNPLPGSDQRVLAISARNL
jgi:16S rRNA (guanine527-N7)-methyltransferase